MKAFIYVGGSILPENVTEHPKGDDLRIAADSGYKNAELLGERVDIFVGDFDSFDGELPESVEVIRLKPEKDLTDTQAAVEIAIDRGANELVIVGGLDGRLDHTMSNLGILVDARLRGFRAVILDGRNRVRFIKNESELVPRSGYTYLSLLAHGAVAKGVEAEGVKYPLRNAKLKPNLQYAVSNEINGNCALVSVRKGELFVIESR